MTLYVLIQAILNHVVCRSFSSLFPGTGKKKKRKINRKLCYVLLIWKRVNIAPLQSNTLLMKENIR